MRLISKCGAVAAAAAACGLLAGQAAAQPYVGASAGRSDFRLDCAGTIECSKRDDAYKVYGGWSFSPNAAVELSYTDLGKVGGASLVRPLGRTETTLSASSWALTAVGSWPVGPVNVFARAGVAHSTGESDTRAGGGSVTRELDSTEFTYGAGATWMITPRIGLRAEWERVRAKFVGSSGQIDLVSAGIVVRF